MTDQAGLRDASQTAETPSRREGIARAAGRGVTRRALVLALLAVPANTYWVVLTYWRFGYDNGTHYPVYSNCLFVLFLLAGVNALVRRRRPDLAFATGELLTVYVVLSVATAWCGPGLLLSLPEAVADPFWYASSSNHWTDVVWPNLPTFLTVSNVPAMAGLFEGDATPYVRNVLLAWVGPSLWWTAISGALMLCYTGLSSIFRRRWVDEDRLLFPMATVPLQIVEERHGLLRNKVMWAGFGVAALFELLATLHGFFPAVPVVPLYFDLGPWLDQYPPWNAIRWKGIGLWPAIIGLCYLMPLDLAFSLWFQDYLVHRLIEVADDLDLTVVFHTGIQAGNYNDPDNARPTKLWNLLRRFPNVRFNLLHGGLPFTGEAGLLAKYFPNVTVDMAWMHAISPELSVRALCDWVDFVPRNKVLGFGGDYHVVEKVYGHLVLARENIATALAAKVERGALRPEEARAWLRALLWDNPHRVYALD